MEGILETGEIWTPWKRTSSWNLDECNSQLRVTDTGNPKERKSKNMVWKYWKISRNTEDWNKEYKSHLELQKLESPKISKESKNMDWKHCKHSRYTQNWKNKDCEA